MREDGQKESVSGEREGSFQIMHCLENFQSNVRQSLYGYYIYIITSLSGKASP